MYMNKYLDKKLQTLLCCETTKWKILCIFITQDEGFVILFPTHTFLFSRFLYVCRLLLLFFSLSWLGCRSSFQQSIFKRNNSFTVLHEMILEHRAYVHITVLMCNMKRKRKRKNESVICTVFLFFFAQIYNKKHVNWEQRV